jgi:hypothetical protein
MMKYTPALAAVFLVFAACAASATPLSKTAASTVTSMGTQKAPSAGASKKGPVLRRSNRMEFDGRLVKGERASGAVYLFQRVPRRLPALLKLKRDQLDRIVMPLLRRSADPVGSVPAVTKALVEKPKAGRKKAARNAAKKRVRKKAGKRTSRKSKTRRKRGRKSSRGSKSKR